MGNIQNKEALKIAENWSGGDCPHDTVNKEYYLGAATGDYICSKCGASGSSRDWPEKERQRKSEN